MTALFDGLGTLLAETFGEHVTTTSVFHGTREVLGMLRRDPIEATDDQGRAVLITAPTLRVPQAEAQNIDRGDLVIAPDGRRYRVMAQIESASPAADKLITFELEDDVSP